MKNCLPIRGIGHMDIRRATGKPQEIVIRGLAAKTSPSPPKRRPPSHINSAEIKFKPLPSETTIEAEPGRVVYASVKYRD